MLRSRTFRRAARVGALLVLAWTALDLSNAELCALDRERLPAPASADPSVDNQAGGDQAPLQSQDDVAVHFDDCFCCSHCVEPTFAFHVEPSTDEAGQPALRTARPPHKRHVSVDRPPQIARF